MIRYAIYSVITGLLVIYLKIQDLLTLNQIKKNTSDGTIQITIFTLDELKYLENV